MVINTLPKQQQWFHQAQSQFRNGDMDAAVNSCSQALAEFPGDANLMVLGARALLALKRFDKSQAQAEKALQSYPQFAAAHDVLGDVMLVQGNAEAALESYQRALNLGAPGEITGQKLARARQTMELLANGPLPRQPMPYADEIARAEQHEKAGQRKEAEIIYRDILKKDPDHVEACRLLAAIAVSHEQFQDAKIFLQRALQLAPDYLRAMVDLANVHRQLEEYEEATAIASKLIELAGDNAEAYMVYASVVGVAGRHEDAIAAFEKALELQPGKAGALCGMAHHLKTIGRQEDAVARYRQSIAVKPDHCESYWSLANLKTFRFEPAEVQAMQELLQNESLPDESRSQIHNALGLEFEARQQYPLAFEHFASCNRIRRKAESYDPVDTEDTHDRVIELFNSKFLQQQPGIVREPTPIFVVGLPRTGSTLIEQILSSHSMVDGTHELSDLSKVIRAMRRGRGERQRFPEVLANLTTDGWSRIGQQYLDRSAKHRGVAAYFIDKNPNNFVFAGLIKLAMPNARIINTRRHPLDSCLGSFKQLFASGQPFSYDMDELAEYYLQYQRLMDHWHKVLPGFVLDVHYEEVVSDLEVQVGRLLEFCGLPFEEACVQFHRTQRAVKTASSEQVRKPIYSSSVHLWRRYEPQLQSLVEILQPLLEQQKILASEVTDR